MQKQPIHLIVTGPESAGKSTLAAKLADELNSDWSKEAARVYLENINRPYTAGDIIAIANLHQSNLTAVMKKAIPIHIFDTSFLVLKIWLKEKFNTTFTWLDDLLRMESNGLYILCKPDIPWTPDPLRENEHDRDRLFAIYEKELKALGKRYVVVSGSVEERVAAVCTLLEG